MPVLMITPEAAIALLNKIKSCQLDYLSDKNTKGHYEYLMRTGGPHSDSEVLLDDGWVCTKGPAILQWIAEYRQPRMCQIERANNPRLIHTKYRLPRGRRGGPCDTITIRANIEHWLGVRPVNLPTISTLIRHIGTWGEALPEGTPEKPAKVPIKSSNLVQANSAFLARLEADWQAGKLDRINFLRDCANAAHRIAKDPDLAYREIMGPANLVWLLYASIEAADWLVVGGSRGGNAQGLLPTINLVETIEQIRVLVRRGRANGHPEYRNTRAGQFMPMLANALIADRIQRRLDQA